MKTCGYLALNGSRKDAFCLKKCVDLVNKAFVVEHCIMADVLYKQIVCQSRRIHIDWADLDQTLFEYALQESHPPITSNTPTRDRGAVRSIDAKHMMRRKV